MTDHKFTVNGQDFSALVHKNGIRTYLEPVYSGEMTTLSGVRRRAVRRYRGLLHVVLNDIPGQQSAALCAALLQEPLTIGYHSFQRGRDVYETMTLEPFARQRLLRDAGEDWMAGVTLKFEQE